MRCIDALLSLSFLPNTHASTCAAVDISRESLDFENPVITQGAALRALGVPVTCSNEMQITLTYCNNWHGAAAPALPPQKERCGLGLKII